MVVQYGNRDRLRYCCAWHGRLRPAAVLCGDVLDELIEKLTLGDRLGRSSAGCSCWREAPDKVEIRVMRV